MRSTLQLRLYTLTTILAAALYAQQTPNHAGHWKGAILAPGQQFRFEVDLTKDDAGKLIGFVAIPDEDLKGIPLKITLDGASIQFHAREDQPFDGVISSDGKSIGGETTLESYTLPFHMIRTGDAAPEPLARGVTIPASVEGEWRGTLETSAGSLKLILTLANTPAGSVAKIIDLDQGGLELPGLVREMTPELKLEITGGASWSGSFTATELTGSYRERDRSVPLNFHRAAAK